MVVPIFKILIYLGCRSDSSWWDFTSVGWENISYIFESYLQ